MREDRIEERESMPTGLSLGLGMNEKAMSNFGKMTEEEKRQVIGAARNVQSKREMQNLIKNIANIDGGV